MATPQVKLQATLDMEASVQKLVEDIKDLQRRLEAAGINIKIKAEIDKELTKDITDQLQSVSDSGANTAKEAGKNIGRNFADGLIQQFGVQFKDAQKQIRDLAKQLESISKTELTSGQEHPEFINTLNQLGEVIERNANIIQERSGDYDDFIQYFKALSAIRIPKDVISELSDEWNYLRSSYAAKFVTDPNKSAIGLDSIYQEMVSKYPNIIPDTTDQVQQFRNIVEAIRSYRADVDNLTPVDPEKITGFRDDMFETLISGISNMREQIRDQLAQTAESAEEIKGESQAMESVGESAEQAATKKEQFAKANKDVAESAETTTGAVDDEHNAMVNMDDIDSIIQNVNFSARQGTSVFQDFGASIQRALTCYTAVALLQRSVSQVIRAAKEGIETVKELNDSATNIQMVTGLDDAKIKAMMQSYNALGQEIGSTTKAIAESAEEWYRQGKSVEDTNKLIEDSMIFSKIAGIDSSDATKYLTSSMNGYNVAVDDVISIVDKLNNVDQNAAVSAAGLAEAMSRTAKSAQLAGVDMDELLGMIGAISEVTQASSPTIGTSLKSMFARMSQIKSGVLKYIDEDTGTEETLSDVETILDKAGIKLRDSSSEFRNFGDVLDEIAGKWGSMNSVMQAGVSKALGGTRMQENVKVLMANWERVKELTDISADSDGVAMQKFDVYLESLEAKTNALKASLEQLATSTISDEMYAAILDLSKGMVDATTESGILKSALVGLGTSATLYGIQKLATLAANAAQEFANLGEAVNITKVGNVGTAELQRLIDLTGGLTQSQTRLLLSTNNLTDAQKVSILMNQGMGRAEAQAQLQAWGLATAQNGASNATITLSSALKGLWTTLLANPLVLVTTVVTAGVMAWNKYKQAQEEAAQKTKEAAESANTLSSDLADLTKQYFELSKAVETDSSKRRDLMSVQEQLLKKLGLEGQSVDDLTKKYGSLSGAIQQATIDSLKAASIDLIAGVNQARKELEKAGKDNLLGTNNSLSATGEQAVEAYKVLESAGLMKAGEYGTQGGIFELYGDSSTIDGIMENYNRLDAALKALRDSGKFTMEELSENPVYKQMYDRWNELKESVDNYNDSIGNLNANMAQQKVLESLQGAALPDSQESFDEYRKGLIESAQASKDFIGTQKDIEQAIDSYLSTLPQFSAFYGDISDAAKVANKGISQVFNKEEMISAINGLSEGFEELDKIYKSVSDSNPFDFSLLDDNKFKETFSDLGDVYTEFVEQVSSTPNDVDKCKVAFNQLITEWLNGSDIISNITAETANLTTAMLTNMGITNAEELVTNALANNEARLAAERYYNANAADTLKDATVDEYAAFLNEADSADVSQMALAQLELAKMAVNNVKIDTSSDIDQVINLANAAGASAEALGKLARAKAIYAKAESTGLNGSAGDLRQLEEADSIMEEISNGTFDYSFSIDASKFKTATYGGGNKSNKTSSSGSGSDSKTTYDWIEQKIKYLTDEQSKFKDELDDTNNSYRTQLNYLSQVLWYQNEIIDAYKTADDAYLQNYKEVSASISEEMRRKIENGDDSVDYEKDSSLSKAKEAWEKYYENHKNLISAEKELQTLQKSGYEKQISWYQEEAENLKTRASSTQKAYLDEINWLDQAVAKEEQVYALAEEHAAEAEAAWKEAISVLQKADIAKILNGTVNLEDYTGDYRDLMETAIKAAEDKSDAEEDLMDKEQELEDTRKEAYEKALEYIQAQQDYISELKSTIESEMDLIDATGGLVYEALYDDLIDKNDELIDQYEDQIDLIYDRLDEVDDESAEYYELLGELEKCTQEINNAKAEQAKLNREMSLLPVERINKFIQMLDIIKKDLENFMDWESGLGQANTAEEYQQLISLEDERISKLFEQLDVQKSLLSEYEYGSELYSETLSDIDDITDAIASAAQEQQEFNNQLLQLPISKITELNESLQTYQSIIQDQLSDQETTLSAVTGLLQREMDKLSDQQDKITENYEDQIEAIEDQLDALEKENTALKVQRDLEQSLYDLQTAKTQKTTKVIRNGIVDYEANADDIRSAQQAVADAQYEKVKYELEESKEKLEELRDQEIENLDDEIDRLDEIKSRWEDICDLISQSINEQTATEFFGEGWQGLILSGNDDALYEQFSQLHTATELQNDSLEKQIASTERVVSQTQIIIDRFNAQEITLEEATSSINTIIGLMKDGYSADEQLSTQLGLDQVSSIEEFSKNTSAQITATMGTLNDTFAVANENNAKIIEIMGTQSDKLEEIRALDAENQRLYEEMLKQIEELNKNYSSHNSEYSRDYDDDDWDGGSGVISRGTYDAETSTYTDHDGNTYDASDWDDKWHTGIEKGLVDDSDRTREDFLKQIATTDLKPDERYAKLLKGEAVFTEPQQEQLIDNFTELSDLGDFLIGTAAQRQALIDNIRENMLTSYQTSLPKVNIADAGKLDQLQNTMMKNTAQSIEFNFGDLNLPNVKDSNSFAKEIGSTFDLYMNQKYSSRLR